MKRSYSFVLLLLLLVAMASACSSAAPSQPGQNTQSTPPAQDTKGPSPTAAGGTTLEESGWTRVLECSIDPPSYIVGFLNERYGISLGIKGEIHYTNNGGQTWTEGANGLKWRLCLDIVDETGAWCGGNGGSVYKSSDGAKTWTRVTDINLMIDHHSIDFTDGNSGWVATRSRLAGTSDGGQTWAEITLPEGTDGIAAICLRSQETGYLLSHAGILYATEDGGQTWSSRDLGFKDYDIIDLQKKPKLNRMSLASADISFSDENNGVIVFIGKSASGPGYHTWCLTTSDGGAAWESKLIPDTGFTPSKVFISGDGQYLTLGDDSNHVVVLKNKAD